jgi:formate hydrogenlyase subunit 6/NADH:ubiquinone oxidoreductase subunit I
MKVTTILGDVMRSLLQRPVTRLYPTVRTPSPENLRGQLRWKPEKCTGCGICAKDCPARAIELIEVDKAAKRFVIRYHTDRCVYCNQCVQGCRFKCLELTSDGWELAATDKSGFTVDYGREEDIRAVVDKPAEPADSTGR